jgi:SM-20-related protein
MHTVLPESYINFAALEQAVIKTEPYPHVVIPQFLRHESLPDLIKNFPSIANRGSIPAESIVEDTVFKQFVAEMQGIELRNWIAQKFSIDLQDKPTMLTLRGHTTERDGFIHTDSKSKLITVLLYMNEAWDAEGGKLRILKNKHSMDDYVAEVSPLAGTCIIFKVTPNCWHGHKAFVGKRLSLQLNYLAGDAALTKHLNHHRLTAWLKKCFPKIFKTQLETY